MICTKLMVVLTERWKMFWQGIDIYNSPVLDIFFKWVVHMCALVFVYTFYISEMSHNNILKTLLIIFLTHSLLI